MTCFNILVSCQYVDLLFSDILRQMCLNYDYLFFALNNCDKTPVSSSLEYP